ncbi:flagellar export protein FliJ [Methylocella sp.]|uniref:flagellar export protein FliJ n=1 Tax=Methylocella sp. TaxID=1978226 RepID=UPI0037848B25
MKLQESVLRLKRFHVEEKRRRVAQIESMATEFTRIAHELEQEIAVEEQRAGIFDASHFAYPTYARAARARRDNLERSARDLMAQLDDARDRLGEAVADLERAEGDGRAATDAGAEDAPGRLRAAHG